MLVDSWVAGDFPCAIVKHERGGHLCGYIGVPPGHPWYGKDESLGPPRLPHIDVHGGITYASHSMYGHPTEIALLERHAAATADWSDMPRPNFWERSLALERERAGTPRNYPCLIEIEVWWIGFDCSHLGDLAPGWPHTQGVYRDEAYVRREIDGLLRQAAEAQEAAGDPASPPGDG